MSTRQKSMFLLILFMCLLSNKALPNQQTTEEKPGGIFYFMHTDFFIMELTNEIPDSGEDKFAFFTVIPHTQPSSLDGQLKLLRSLFNIKEVILKEESKELEWKLKYCKEKSILPRIIQEFEMGGNQYEITLFPIIEDNRLEPGYKINVSLVKSLPEENGKALQPLKIVFDELPGCSISKGEVRSFGNLFFICFPMGKKLYVLSVYQKPVIGAIIHRSFPQ